MLSLLLVGVLAGGCAGPTPTPGTDPFGAVPEDFSIDWTILSAVDSPDAHVRQARYVLFPDGSLHYEAHARRGPATLPGLTRRLSREQVARLWAEVQSLGLADPSRADPVVNFALVDEPEAGIVYLVAFTGEGRYWNFVRHAAPGTPRDPAVPALVSFVRLLAHMAWADESSEELGKALPLRYDLGQDPHARYRRH